MEEIKSDNFIKVREYKKDDDVVSFTTKHKFFDDNLIIIDETDRIVFAKPGLDYRGKTRAFYEKKGWFGINYFRSYIKPGKYYFDEEDSNEDQMVIYYEID